MDIESFAQQVDLIRDVVHTPRSPGKAASRWLGVLDVFIEELDVSIEELRQQNEELHLTQHLLGQETERYRNLFHLAPDGYIITDLMGVIREANQTAATILQVEPRNLTGKPLSVFVDPEHRRAFRRLLLSVQSGTPLEELDVKLRPRGRASFEAELAVRVGQDVAGEPDVLRWTLRDLTARNHSLNEARSLGALLEQQLSSQAVELEQAHTREIRAAGLADLAQQRLSTLSDVSDTLSSSADSRTPLTVLLSSVIPTMADWGVVALLDDAGTLIEREFKHVDAALDQSHTCALSDQSFEPGSMLCCASSVLKSGMPHVLAKGGSFSPECTAPRALDWIPHDDPARISVMAVPLRSRGTVLGVLEMGRGVSWPAFNSDDLTFALELTGRSSLALDNAVLYERSQVAANVRDQFLAVAAHELRTPITILRGYAQILSKQLSGTATLDPVKAYRMARAIEQQSDHLTSLVEQLVDVSRAESGKLAIRPVATDVSQLITSQVENAQLTTARHQFEHQITPDIWASVDAVRFEQVVSNLLDNAIKFSINGGPIAVTFDRANDDRLRLTVADRGIGIEPFHRERIFERFYLGHQRSDIRGLGLGLFISREIMRLHGGDLSVKFPKSGMTMFVAEFPVDTGTAVLD